ncbi:MAG: hypothetical protein MI757_12915 [Pirellulales bacterium]|nr:hypothetical protein [Pirellulales bacterium]
MLKSDLVELFEQRPFVPVRLHMSNGRTHVVKHPELAIIGMGTVAIGVEGEDGENHIKLCAIDHITEAEPAESPTAQES